MAEFFTCEDAPSVRKGRIAAHDLAHLKMYVALEMVRNGVSRRRLSGMARRARRSAPAGLARRRDIAREDRGRRQGMYHLLFSMALHFLSYNMACRPNPFSGHEVVRMVAPWHELTEYDFMRNTRFEKEDFMRICDLLTLLPAMITTPHRVRASKELAVYILLRRWVCPDTWYHIEKEMRTHKSTLIAIYETCCLLVSEAYRKVVTHFDFLRIQPLLGMWAQTLSDLGCSLDTVVGFCDGKADRCCMPSHGDGAAALALACGLGYTVNLIQQAFYNGYYGFHGLKVQHLILGDSMVYCFAIDTIRRHDAAMFTQSSMPAQLSLLFCDHPLNTTPALVHTDQAYPSTANIHPKATTGSLNAMTPANRARREALDANLALFRLSIENSFSKHVTLFPYANCFTKKRLFQGGQCRVDVAMDTWWCQVFFLNLHTCLYGSQSSGMFTIEPPSPAEYLRNINAGYYV